MTTASWVILTVLGNLCLLLVFVTLFVLLMLREERRRASLDSERTSSASQTQSSMTLELIAASQRQTEVLAAAVRGVQESQQTAVGQMLQMVTSTISRIVSPPQLPPSDEVREFQAMMNQPQWEQVLTGAEVREHQESQPMAGWANGAVNPYAHGNLPPDVPGPIGENAQMPGVIDDL